MSGARSKIESPSILTIAAAFRELFIKILFIKILFLALACHSALLPATLVNAAHIDHREVCEKTDDARLRYGCACHSAPLGAPHPATRLGHAVDDDHRDVCKMIDDNRLRYGCALPYYCVMQTPAPAPAPVEPPNSDNALVPWDIHYMNVSNNYEYMAASPDGLHVNLGIINDHIVSGRMYSINLFLFGYFSMNMKLVPNESAGVVSTFYLSSLDTDTRDEIDFEFLGNTSGNPVTLHTNLYLDGSGRRQQNHNLPFDPTAAFHKYSILWNQHLVMSVLHRHHWFVDDEVIRVFHNKSNEIAVPFPMTRPIQVMCSIWTPLNLTRDWVTQGGHVHIDYNYAPFVAQYEGFGGLDGCPVCAATPPTAFNDADISACSDANKYWFLEQEELTEEQVKQLTEHRQKYLIDDYCRNPEGAPAECPYNSYDT